jgi:malonyl-CoA O-methyltransferase
MPIEFHKAGMARGFSAAADTYERWAQAQRLIARRLIELLPASASCRRIADLGCGTGLLTEKLHRHAPQANILGLDLAPGMVQHCRQRWSDNPHLEFAVADLETAEFAEPYDLIVSSCAFQWLGDPARTFARLGTALAPDGTLAFSVLVGDTLGELRQSYRSVFDTDLPGIRYGSTADYRTHLKQAGLRIQLQKQENVRLFYPTAREALQSFKGIGATFRHQDGYRPHSPGQLRHLFRHYETHARTANGKLPMTYQVAYFVVDCAPANVVFPQAVRRPQIDAPTHVTDRTDLTDLSLVASASQH